jgi:hypothetical protein
VLSTCQRTEIYATWTGEPDDPALLTALALDRGIPSRVLHPVAKTYRGDAAARHLLRVASGLESFVLGETEIAGQLRAAADISRTVGGGDVVLERSSVEDGQMRHGRKSRSVLSGGYKRHVLRAERATDGRSRLPIPWSVSLTGGAQLKSAAGRRWVAGDQVGHLEGSSKRLE